jgi:hypothetical protein
MQKHLAILYPEVIKQIFSGQKTIETRFSKSKIAPFSQIKVGDLVYMKPPGKDIQGQFWVNKVISFENLDSADLEYIKKHYGDKLSLGSRNQDQAFFELKKDAKYGTLIFIGRVDQLITSPIKLEKRDQRGWVVLD